MAKKFSELVFYPNAKKKGEPEESGGTLDMKNGMPSTVKEEKNSDQMEITHRSGRKEKVKVHMTGSDYHIVKNKDGAQYTVDKKGNVLHGHGNANEEVKLEEDHLMDYRRYTQAAKNAKARGDHDIAKDAEEKAAKSSANYTRITGKKPTFNEAAKSGLWANIHAKRKRIKAGSGEKMRKPGSEGAPTKAALKASQNEETILEYEIDHDGKGNYRDDEGNEWTSKSKNAPRGSFARKHTITSDSSHAVHINGKKWKSFGSQSHAQNVANKIKGATVHKEEYATEQAPVAPTLDKKYIKGTPEHKAYKATKKPINGHPTNIKEEHLVHVSDGSKYGDKPNKKDVDHVMAGAKKHKGEFDGNSDKGAYFKFKSHEDAKSFKKHVDSCPGRSCYADLHEAVDKGEYDYEGQMARTQLQTTMRNCEDLIDMLEDDENMPEWVQSKITLAQDYITTVRDYLQSKEELDEKINLSTSKMGDVIKDFQKSDAPQFAGKSDEKKRQMAIAAKLQADSETKKEETMLTFASFVEALKGNQHKIDKNKNGEVDAHDFKLLRKEETEQIDESRPNGREYASHGLMHPDHAKMDIHKTSNQEVDFYASKTGDKMQGKVLKNDGKEVHIKAHKELGDGKLHKFKVSANLPAKTNEEVEIEENAFDYKSKKSEVSSGRYEIKRENGRTIVTRKYNPDTGMSTGTDDNEPAEKRGRGRPAGSKNRGSAK